MLNVGGVEVKSTVEKGFSLIELLVTVLIVALIVGIAAPNMADYWHKSRLVSASEAVYSNLQLGRSVTLARSSDIVVDFGDTNSTSWCLALSDNMSCDCTGPTDCQLTNMPNRLVDGSEFSVVNLTTSFGDNAIITYPRGTLSFASDEVSVALSSTYTNDSVQILVNQLGRVRICSDDLDEYSDCN